MTLVMLSEMISGPLFEASQIAEPVMPQPAAAPSPPQNCAECHHDLAGSCGRAGRERSSGRCDRVGRERTVRRRCTHLGGLVREQASANGLLHCTTQQRQQRLRSAIHLCPGVPREGLGKSRSPAKRTIRLFSFPPSSLLLEGNGM